MSKIFVIISLILTMYTMGFAQVSPGTRSSNINPVALHGDLEAAVADGANIYLVTVSSWSMIKQDQLTEKGRVTLVMNKVILGEKKDTLILPYAWQRGAVNFGDRLDIWPRLDRAKKDQLYLCVYFTGAIDPTVGSIDGADGAASEFIPVADPGDNRVTSLVKAINLMQLPKGDKLNQGLLNTATSDDPIVRNFVIAIAARQVAKSDPVTALQIILAQADERKRLLLNDGERLRIAQYLADVENLGVNDAKTRNRSIQMLSDLVIEAAPQQQGNFLQRMVYWLNGPNAGTSATKVLTAEQISDLKSVVEKLSGSKNIRDVETANRIRHWIDHGDN